MNRLLFVLYGIIWSVGSLYAQKKNLQFVHYTTEQGLTSNIVNCITQTSDGLIWIATENGINKFDAYHFSSYRYHQSQKGALAGNITYFVFEDSQK